MSGPKISTYELSAWQRKNLREQLSCIGQSFACVEQIKQSVGHLNGFGEQIESLLNTLALINGRTGDCSDEINVLYDVQRNLEHDCSSFIDELSLNMPVLSDKMTINEDELNEKKALLGKLKSTQTNIVLYQKKIEQTLSDIRQKAHFGVGEVKSGIADDIAAVSSFYIELDESDGESFSDLQNKLENKLRSLSINDVCPKSMKSEIFDTMILLARISTIEHLNTFDAVTIKPLLKKYDKLVMQEREQWDLFEELKSRYSALCAIAQKQVKEFSLDNADIELLTLEISALEKQFVAQTEQEYISGCVNEVMTEMGYDLIGNRSVTKRSGKHFKNELFSYDDGTAINVTYDSDGQIAMELGGIDRSDRIPTSDETDVLCENMESFCTDFKVFEEKLKAKGVSVSSRISMAPPTAEYAAIINVEDYSITTTYPIPDMVIENKRKRSAIKQTLRKENN